ncbi:major facilitator superfamily multidrug-resistance, DHA1 sub-family [Pluteus cervinus]|uniref:Major facilitator superfamily multidrug-resistance, DHA1 sub-family n=1 Tax=Pluteus cervinus TaxID=181527 RepID=A0ACD3BFJ8_9AGAR|nr:major facilitator superfamily multidrug-resistance, DHA1 sub-family [Pluteus cervinus]
MPTSRGPFFETTERGFSPSTEGSPLLPIERIRRPDSPFLWGQLGILCYLRLLDPLNFTQIFPYVNEMINDLGIAKNPTHVGLYSGIVESSFAMCQLLAICPWACASDRIGRRPVILMGICGLALSALALGLSHNFVQLVVARGLGGLFSGNVAVIPTVLCEITDEKSQSFAFPFFGLWWPVGSILGPLIGGTLAKPGNHFPRLLRYEVLNRNPYLLPCLVLFALTAFGAFLCCWLDETLESKSDSYAPPEYGAVADSHGTPAPCSSPSMRELMAVPFIRALCVSSCSLSFVTTAFDVVFVLFCYSPIEQGGLAMSSTAIGYALAISGLMAAILQVFFMPFLLREYYHADILHFCSGVWPYTFASMPLLSLVAQQSFSDRRILWVGLALVLMAARVGSLGYSINTLLVKKYAKGSAIGSTNGLVQLHICLSRAISPTFVSWLFMFSASRNGTQKFLWIFVTVVLACTSHHLSRRVVVESRKLEYHEA